MLRLLEDARLRGLTIKTMVSRKGIAMSVLIKNTHISIQENISAKEMLEELLR